MSRTIDLIRKASQGRRRRIEIPEWPQENGAPLALFFSPLTSDAIDGAADRMKDDGLDPNVRQRDHRLYLLIYMAEREDGTKAFEFGDFGHLKSVADYVVLQRLIAFMYETSIPFTGATEEEVVADARKKSGKTEASTSASE